MQSVNRLIIIALFLLGQDIHGQQLLPLAVGDKIPDLELGESLTESGRKLHLSQFRSKLRVLDFWSASCVACIRAIPYLDSLQQEFGKDISVLMLTKDKKETVEKVFRKTKTSPLFIPVVLADTLFVKLFPYNSVPHHVWINEQGIVQFITQGYNTSRENIKTFLSGKPLSLSVKKELGDFDPEQPLWLEGNGRLKGLMRYYSFLMKKIDAGIGGYSRKIDSAKGTVTIKCINQSVLSLFRIAFGNFPMGKFDGSNRLLFEAGNPGELLGPVTNAAWEEWASQNVFCYELSLPLENADQWQPIMQQEMNRWFKYEALVEKRPVKCLVLVRTSENDKLRSAGGKFQDLSNDNSIHITNLDFKQTFIRSLIGMNKEAALPIIDETGYEGKCDLSLEAGYKDMVKLKMELRKYDLDLIEAEKQIEMLVITEKGKEKR
jgi:thiol-disulfide isomerase/thioredoxin